MTDIAKNIRQLIRVLLDMPVDSVRKAEQNAPTGAVSDQFATVKLVIEQATGRDEVRYTNTVGDDVTETITGQRLVFASVNFFRTGAVAKTNRLIALLESSRAIQLMQELGLGLVRTSPARNLSAVVDTKWEERGQLDIEFHAIAREDLTLPTYGTFEIDLYAAERNPDGTFPPPQVIEVIEP